MYTAASETVCAQKALFKKLLIVHHALSGKKKKKSTDTKDTDKPSNTVWSGPRKCLHPPPPPPPPIIFLICHIAQHGPKGCTIIHYWLGTATVEANKFNCSVPWNPFWQKTLPYPFNCYSNSGAPWQKIPPSPHLPLPNESTTPPIFSFFLYIYTFCFFSFLIPLLTFHVRY